MCVSTNHRFRRIPSRLRHDRLLSQLGLGRQLPQLLAQVGEVERLLRRLHQLLDARLDRLLLLLRCQRGLSHRAAHDRTEFAGVRVKHKQFLGEQRLVVQHVHQKTQCAEVVTQELKGTGVVLFRFRGDQELYAAAHPDDRLHRRLQTQDRQHTAHLRETGHHLVQQRFFARLPKELIQRLFGLGQRQLELIDHAAHGVLVTHPPVELLHPTFKGLRVRATQHHFQSLSQGLRALGEGGFAGVKVFKRSLKVQRGRGHLHGQVRPLDGGLLPRGKVYRLDERLGQDGTAWMELEQGVREQPVLINHLPAAMGITTREQRP